MIPIHRENGASERIHRQLEETLAYYSAHGHRIAPRLRELDREWSLERVLEAEASLACICGLAVGGIRGKRRWLALSALGAGYLLFRALRGRQPPARFLRRLGFRTEREMDLERRLHEALLDARSTPAGPDASPALSKVPIRTKPRRKPWYSRARYWIVAGILLVGVSTRIAAPYVIARQLRGGLQNMEGFSGGFRDVSLTLSDLKLTIHDFTMDRVPAADAQEPMIQVKALEVGLFAKPLLSGRIVAEASFIEPRMHIVLAAAKAETKAEPPPPPEPPDIGAALKKGMPVRIDRIEIQRGEMTIVDSGEPNRPEIRLGEIEATIENIETGTQMGNGRPSVFSAHGKLQESGEMRIFYTADLLSKALTFAGQAELKGLKLAEINPMITSKTGMKVERGEFDVFTAFSAEEGRIRGGVKPLMKNVRMTPWKEDLITKLKTGLTDAALRLFSDRVPSREAVVALVPFEGDVTSPRAPILPTVMTVVRNAFVIGLASGFAHLPPEQELREGLAAQKGEGGEAKGSQ